MTSLAAFHARVDERNPQSLGEESAIRVYARSKRLLTLCALALAGEGLPVTLAHPGVSATDLFSAGADAPAFGAGFLRVALPLMRRLFMAPEKAALPAVYALSLPAGRMAYPRGLWQTWGLPRDGAPGRLGGGREARAALALVKNALHPPENGTECTCRVDNGPAR